MNTLFEHAVAAQRFLLRHLILFLAVIGLLNIVGLHSFHVSVTDKSVTFSFVSESEFVQSATRNNNTAALERDARERTPTTAGLRRQDLPESTPMEQPTSTGTQAATNATVKPRFQQLDFYIAAFPKCGTTTLQHVFAKHKETAMHKSEEECDLARTKVVRAKYARRAVIGHLRALSRNNPKLKRGIKCPLGLKNPTGVERIHNFFPETKLVIGVRHPVAFFQSYYNYRITENYLQMNSSKYYDPEPPPMESLVDDSEEWKDLNTRAARFEEFLTYLGKTKTDEYPKTPFRVFLYTVEQLNDKDVTRQERFRSELQSFLELKQPIPPFPRVNANKHVGIVNGTVDICDRRYDFLRQELVASGKASQRWILESFLQSADVAVANQEHFRELLRTWQTDPCAKRKGSSGQMYKAVDQPVVQKEVVQPTKADEEKPRDRQLYFYIAAFPRCEGATIRHTLAVHNETAIDEKEECSLGMSKLIPPSYAQRTVNKRLQAFSKDPLMKRGIECPIGLKNRGGVKSTVRFFPEAKLIIGVRHPVYYFQNFYNYRVTEQYHFKKNATDSTTPPPIQSLIGKRDWLGVSTSTARFETYLMRLGKTDNEEYASTPFKVFLYAAEQLDDTDEQHQKVFRDELQEFLELKQPIPSLRRANTTIERVEGTVNICDSEYDDLRKELMSKGEETQRWILNEFIQSPDVAVANVERFKGLLQQWGADPCVAMTE